MQTEFVDALDDAVGAQKATDVFTAAFGQAPAGVWAAPGRVNLIGEHTDYNAGMCLPIALPHRTFVAMSARTDREVHLATALGDEKPIFNLDQVGPVGSPGEVSSWPAYIVGVLWALEQAGYKLPGFNIADATCVPLGSGLSSSAALECSVAVGACELAGLDLPDSPAGRAKLVEVCRRAENEVAGAPTGGLDQSASLLCQAGHALELDFLSGTNNLIPFDLAHAGMELLVIDTRAPHQLNDGQYAARREDCNQAAKILGVEYLAELDPENLEQILSQLPNDQMRSRVCHVVTEIERTQAAIEVLQEGPLTDQNLALLGALFNASHNSLQKDYEVSCPELDLAVQVARDNGACGARMTGGGFGGSAIAVVPAGSSEKVAEKVAQAFQEAGFAAPQFLVAVASAPAGKIR